MNAHKATVYIVDDDTAFRESLEDLVGMMGYQVFGFGSAEAFWEQTSIRRPACLILDIFLPNIDGLALQKKLRSREGALPVIFITGHGDVPMSVKAMKTGAVDFLLKPFKAKDLRFAIVQALEKDACYVKEEASRQEIQSRINSLTPREQEVMRQIITGNLNKQIASVLGTAEKTIRKHRSRVMRKMRISSVADLVRMLEKVGIVHPSVGLSR